MLKLTVAYISLNLWVSKSPLSGLYYIGYKDELLYKCANSFSLYHNKILAIKQSSTVFIYLFNIGGFNSEDALTLICTLNDKDEYDFSLIKIDNTFYNIDKSCNITAIKGRT